MLAEIFQTNELKVLMIMYKAQTMICGEPICTLRQIDIANEMKMSRVVINNICNTLRKQGYIEMDTRSRWRITTKAEKIINLVKSA